MKRLSYVCNLCGTSEKEETIYALLFSIDDNGRQYFVIEEAKHRDSDTHICESCRDKFENTFTEVDDEEE